MRDDVKTIRSLLSNERGLLFLGRNASGISVPLEGDELSLPSQSMQIPGRKGSPTITQVWLLQSKARLKTSFVELYRESFKRVKAISLEITSDKHTKSLFAPTIFTDFRDHVIDSDAVKRYCSLLMIKFIQLSQAFARALHGENKTRST